MDFACVSSKKRDVMAFFDERGFLGDPRFNTLHGDRQMYFTTADGKTSVDVIMDKLNMCHVLDFSDRIDRMPDTLDVTDLLLTKLQIVELNEKDVHDLLHLLSAFEVRAGDEPGTIGLDRIGRLVAGDWGWWRTVTMNLDKLSQLAADEATTPTCCPRPGGSSPPSRHARSGPSARGPEDHEVEAPGQGGRPGPVVRAARGGRPLGADRGRAVLRGSTPACANDGRGGRLLR